MLKSLNRLCQSILGKQDLPSNIINTSKQPVSYPPYVDFSVPTFNDEELQEFARVIDSEILTEKNGQQTIFQE